ncbi:MAG: hypothetical protein KF757_03545 [Phycisphaeraceae bacterium]|nr:hypothetical protein [Phycisphaeraceae bacterium]MCW5763078.1 hypothetical protein [Phycisphaeraceae bacterium]
MEMALADAMSEMLQGMIGQHRKELEKRIGVPMLEVQGTLLQRLSATPAIEIPLNYEYPDPDILASAFGQNAPPKSWLSRSYSDLEHARAEHTAWPSSKVITSSATSTLYTMNSFLNHPGPASSAAVVVIFDEDNVFVGLYQIWFVVSEFQWPPSGDPASP